MAGGHKGRAIGFTWGGVEYAGVREKGQQASGERVDTTSDDDDGWRTLAENGAAQDQVDLTVSGVVKDDQLRRAWFDRDRIKTGGLLYPDGGETQGTFHLISYNETGPYNDAFTFEAAFQSSGPVVYVPGS